MTEHGGTGELLSPMGRVRELSRRIDRYPPKLTQPQLGELYREYRKQSAAEPQLPADADEAQREAHAQRIGQMRLNSVLRLRNNPVFPQRLATGEATKESSLFDALFKDSASIPELIGNANLRLVVSKVQKRARSAEHFLELYAAGCVGLMNAIEYFKPEKGFEFSSYAGKIIDREVGTLLLQQDSVSRLPLAEMGKAANIIHAYRDSETMMPSVPALIAEYRGKYPDVSEEDARLYVTLALDRIKYVLSLDEEERGREYETRGDNLVAPPTYARRAFSAATEAEFVELTDAEIDVLRMYYGENAPPSHVDEHLGKEGASRAILQGALAKLATNPTLQQQWLGKTESGEIPQAVAASGGQPLVEIPKNPNLTATQLHATMRHRLESASYEERPAVIAELIGQARSLLPIEGNRFVAQLFREFGSSTREDSRAAEYEILTGLDFGELSRYIVVKSYITRVRQMDPGLDPVSMLHIGDFLADTVTINNKERVQIQRAWGDVIQTGYATSDALRAVAAGVDRLLTKIERTSVPEMDVLEVFASLRAEEFFGGEIKHDGSYAEGSVQAQVRAEAEDVLARLTPAQSQQLAMQLIRGLGRDDQIWDVNRRDVGLELLKRLNLRDTDMEAIRDWYVKNIRWQPETADPLGSIASLAEAGVVLEPNMPRDLLTRRRLRAAWTTIDTVHGNKAEWEAVSSQIVEPTLQKITTPLDEIEIAMLEDYREYTAADVAEKYGLERPEDVWNLVRSARQRGIIADEQRKPKATPTGRRRQELVVAMRRYGLSVAEIHEKTKIPSKTIYTLIDRYRERTGEEVRPDTEAEQPQVEVARLEDDDVLVTDPPETANGQGVVVYPEKAGPDSQDRNNRQERNSPERQER